MASEVKTNKISPAVGTDVTLGDTSDTFTVPSGSAIAVASGGDINVLSGGEIDIASGATLDVNGTIDLTGATKTGFPAGGLTRASQWRLNTNRGVGNGTTWDYITANLTVATSYGYGSIGADFATPTSGVFTFPETGTWLITFVGFYTAVSEPNMINLAISTTIDDSAYNHAAEASSSEVRAAYNGSAMCNFLFNVSSVSTHKVKFGVRRALSSGTLTALGDTNKNETSITFLRLGDST